MNCEQKIAARAAKVQARSQRHSTRSREKMRKNELKKRVSTGSTEPLGDVIECSVPSPYYCGNVAQNMQNSDQHFQTMSARNRMAKDDAGAAFGHRCRPVVTGFGVHAMHGKKRHVRGGSSQDAFTAVWDLFDQFGDMSSGTASAEQTQWPQPTPSQWAMGASPGGGPGGPVFAQIRTPQSPEERQANLQRRFHLFGVFDGHRSDHAARYIAQNIGLIVTAYLQQPGVLQPLPPGDVAVAAQQQQTEVQQQQERQEQQAIREALTAAVEQVDRQISAKRWVSVVRDNTKNFYPMYEKEVPVDFDLPGWDARHIENTWRMQFSDLVQQEAICRGVPEQSLQAEVMAQQGKWFCRKQELFPGSALIMLLVDDDRQTVYCVNSGDSRCVLACRPCEGMGAGAGVGGSAPPKAESKEVGGGGGGGGQGAVGLAGTRGSGAVAEGKPIRPVLPVALSQDHKPSDPGELARVCSTPMGTVHLYGEMVTPETLARHEAMAEAAQAVGKKAIYRINRDLSLSRSIGDADLKQYGVIATPDVVVRKLMRRNQSQQPSSVFDAGSAVGARESHLELVQQDDKDHDGAGAGVAGSYADEFIVLACDGIWDTLSDRQAVQLVDRSLAGFSSSRNDTPDAEMEAEPKGGGSGSGERSEEASCAALALAQYAFTSPCTNDDITAIVLTLRGE